ncbi:hypothetical protein ACOMDM_08985 [Serratia plymuthica]|jgi:hypothetical protein|uniref:Uncharacterized protein n=2 Tax=Serratia plymuthica TaxID=82996 RepID=A0A2X4XB16_SERPL|nr:MULTISPECIES: hypothetical protein [Serratia]AEF44941.1 hypothetical protein SerAS9_1812 [Serratia plymuthica AS9]AEF49893.1 hypothetical protein SerAS12_1812 [Serratia sp. AS12]AEG27600.1 hypothetical protein SerAS13_1813 [Serratia sp. AS13]AGO54674.1 hypothetical protein SOD_c16950 [Serratia plymuthica 4Rx13]AGP43987.1 hypothetical protein M621_09390 [Serratia plymuthica S13]
MTDKDTSAQEAIPENATLLKILGRLLSALDSSISGKDRSILVTELSSLNLDGISESERKLAAELIRRALQSLDH